MHKILFLLSCTLLCSLAASAQLETHKWKIVTEPLQTSTIVENTTHSTYPFLPNKMDNKVLEYPAATLSFNKEKGLCYIESESGTIEGQYFLSDETHLTIIIKDIKYPFTIVRESEHKIYLSGQYGRLTLLGFH
jgi:hypothetical protein